MFERSLNSAIGCLLLVTVLDSVSKSRINIVELLRLLGREENMFGLFWEALFHVKIDLMITRTQLPKPEHLSYKKHRRQTMNQIVLPVILSALVMIALIVLVSLATFGADGDVARWAAVSTIWLVIPLMFAGLIVLIILVGFIYIIARGLQIIPIYTAIAQDYIAKARWYITRGANMLVKPFLVLEGWSAQIQKFFRKDQ